MSGIDEIIDGIDKNKIGALMPIGKNADFINLLLKGNTNHSDSGKLKKIQFEDNASAEKAHNIIASYLLGNSGYSKLSSGHVILASEVFSINLNRSVSIDKGAPYFSPTELIFKSSNGISLGIDYQSSQVAEQDILIILEKINPKNDIAADQNQKSHELMPYDLTFDQFYRQAKAIPLINHGQKYTVMLNDQDLGFSGANSIMGAFLEVHQRCVNNALYSISSINTGGSPPRESMPPDAVLNEYPETAEKFFDCVDFTGTCMQDRWLAFVEKNSHEEDRLSM